MSDSVGSRDIIAGLREKAWGPVKAPHASFAPVFVVSVPTAEAAVRAAADTRTREIAQLARFLAAEVDREVEEIVVRTTGRDTLRDFAARIEDDHCGQIMVGSGTDTYDPICELPAGHDGSCKSSAAVDQHRIARRFPVSDFDTKDEDNG